MMASIKKLARPLSDQSAGRRGRTARTSASRGPAPARAATTTAATFATATATAKAATTTVTTSAAAARSTLFINSIAKGFQVLEAFSGGPQQMTLSDIARRSRLDRSAAQRVVHTLETLGYLQRIPDTTMYGLSLLIHRTN